MKSSMSHRSLRSDVAAAAAFKVHAKCLLTPIPAVPCVAQRVRKVADAQGRRGAKEVTQKPDEPDEARLRRRRCESGPSRDTPFLFQSCIRLTDRR